MLQYLVTYSLDLRERVISHIKNGASQVEVARLFSINYRTISYRLKKTDLKPKKHGLRNRKIDKKKLREDMVMFMVTTVNLQI